MEELTGSLILKTAKKCLADGRLFHARYLLQQGTSFIVTEAEEMDTEEEEVVEEKLRAMALAEECSLCIARLNTQINNMIKESNSEGYIEVPANQFGYGYNVTLRPFFKPSLRELIIEEPLMTTSEHFDNLAMLVEFSLLYCKQLVYVEVVTLKASGKTQQAEQLERLENVKTSLQNFGVYFGYRFLSELRETRVIFSDGIIIRITEHGLHYLQAPPTTLRIGWGGQRCRKSKETVLTVYRIQKK